MGLCFLCRCVGSMTGPASDVSTTQFYWDNDVTQDKPDPDVWSHLGGLTLQQDQQDVSFIFNSIKKTQEPENRSQESQILNEKDKTRLNHNCNSVQQLRPANQSGDTWTSLPQTRPPPLLGGFPGQPRHGRSSQSWSGLLPGLLPVRRAWNASLGHLKQVPDVKGRQLYSELLPTSPYLQGSAQPA